MKTLIALMLLTSACFAQTIHDIEKTKVRMRIRLNRLTPTGSLCNAGALVKNKLGREEVKKDATGDPFALSALGHVINVIDLASKPMKPGDEADMSLYPVASSAVPMYAISASNVPLYQQGRFKINITRESLEKMSFEVTLYEVLASIEGAQAKATPLVLTHVKNKPDEVKEEWHRQFDVVIKGNINLINNAQKFKGMPRVKLYPTSLPSTFTLTVEDALKDYQVPP